MDIAQHERAQRVWRYNYVVWLTWLFFAGFFGVRGFSLASDICVVSVAVTAAGMIALRNSTNHRLNMNFVFGVSGAGLLSISLIHPSLHWTLLFFAVAIMVGAQLFGVRAAFRWLLVSYAAGLIHFLSRFGLDALLLGDQFDGFILLNGTSTCIFFCCHQAEEYFQLRTKNLVELSKDLKRQGEQLHVLATVDSLTGLMNRFQFQKELESSVAKSVSDNRTMALLVIDMDGFKEINDTLGHTVGDEALMIIAERLRTEFGRTSIVARLGGDEFCIIHTNVENRESVTQLATSVNELLCERYETADNKFAMGASVGVAYCPEDTRNARDLLAFADTAMYKAKEDQLLFASYEQEMTQALIEYRATQDRLAEALCNDEFFLVYQPKVDLHKIK